MKQFEEIYQNYFEDVFKYLRGLTANEHLAQDLTSDTFFKAMHAIDDFREPLACVTFHRAKEMIQGVLQTQKADSL